MKGVLYFFIAIVAFMALSCRENDRNIVIKKEIADNWEFSQSGKDDWMPAVVPGTVHTDLLANGKIEDPFYRLNEHDVQWIDKVGWDYKTSFTVEDQMMKRDVVELVFNGLDTYADVFLNGTKVLSADNMFRTWNVNVKEWLKKGENDLVVKFKSPIKEGIKKYDAQGYVIPVSGNDLAEIGQVEDGKKVSVYTRKAGYHFGWDWGPRFVTSGIWRPIELLAWNNAKINNLQIVQKNVTERKATFTANFEVDAVKKAGATLSVINDKNTLVTTNIDLKKGVNTYSVDFEIDNPKLWWTNGLGEPHLYTLTGKLETGNGITTTDTRIGIRTLELVREKDDAGTTFFFKLNGHPVFMKGA
ncbi:MAG: beta-mannosidase, partial [Draconibacterium sp.]